MDNRKIRIKKVAVFLSFFLMLTFPLMAQEAGDKTISGTVDAVDWVKSTLTVRYLDIYSGDADEVNILVSADTQISRDADSISLSDILQSDPVTVIYYDAGLSGLKARRITDLNTGNR